MGERYNLNLQNETDLLMVQRDYINDLASFDLVMQDTLELLIAIESRMIKEPNNIFLPRLKAFIRNPTQLSAM